MPRNLTKPTRPFTGWGDAGSERTQGVTLQALNTSPLQFVDLLPAPKREKKGFFARLFGKKTK